MKSLVFKNCAFIDDWAVARLANFATNKIEYLDLSGCLNITDNGLIMLGYLRYYFNKISFIFIMN